MIANVLALIPARANSKGVPGKNKRIVQGKPLIGYSIEAALASKRVTHTAVSTDDPDILAIAKAAGVLCVNRPRTLAEDASPVIDAVRQAATTLREREGLDIDCVVLLQPTSPLRTAEDIDNAVDLFYQHGKRPVCSVYRCEDNHPARMYTIENGRLKSLMPELSSVRRQDLPGVYHRNGALYVFGAAEIASGKIISDAMTPYVMPQSRSINIDVELDLLVLDAVLARR